MDIKSFLHFSCIYSISLLLISGFASHVLADQSASSTNLGIDDSFLETGVNPLCRRITVSAIGEGFYCSPASAVGASIAVLRLVCDDDPEDDAVGTLEEIECNDPSAGPDSDNECPGDYRYSPGYCIALCRICLADNENPYIEDVGHEYLDPMQGF